MSSSCVSSEWQQLMSHSGAEMGVKSPSLEGSLGLFLPAAEPTDGGPSTILGFVSILRDRLLIFILATLDVRVITDCVTYVRDCQPP